jgi:subtilase family serine protease
MTAHFKASRHLARTVAMAAALLIASTAASVHAAGWTRMHGHRSAAMAAAPLVGEVSATRVFPLAIGLAWRDSAGLKSLLAQIYDPQSPQYRRYLSADDFTQRFGPTDTDYQAVAQHLQALGLRVVGQHANRLILDVEGNADQIQAAFHVRLHEYRRGDGSSFFGPDDEPSLDTGLPILHISGLDDFVKPHPLMVQSAVSSATPRIGSGPSGLLEGNDFRNAYAPGVSLNGAGQSVALFELDTYYPNDLASYRTQTGLNTPVTNVYLDGWDSSHTPGGGNGEAKPK